MLEINNSIFTSIEKRKNKQICVVVNIDEFVNLIEGMQNNNIKLNKIFNKKQGFVSGL